MVQGTIVVYSPLRRKHEHFLQISGGAFPWRKGCGTPADARCGCEHSGPWAVQKVFPVLPILDPPPLLKRSPQLRFALAERHARSLHKD